MIINSQFLDPTLVAGSLEATVFQPCLWGLFPTAKGYLIVGVEVSEKQVALKAKANRLVGQSGSDLRQIHLFLHLSLRPTLEAERVEVPEP